ncbi:MAG TPA: phosphoenolpyruvate carboxykinase [Candidatus Dormibacteraeota bacterium]|jgi:phosphoenolpyruvate carboxykinase (ATP)|nr:phosphoenolpyruvate carboxykinase [Candidatus Dormibacteraeota bacterium]
MKLRPYIPAARNLVFNPSAEELKAMTLAMPNAKLSEFDNCNVQTEVDSRSKASTYIVSDRPEEHPSQTITRAEGERLARMQDDYIAGVEMLVVDGYIGNADGFKTPARLIIEKANANIAGMQKILYYDADDAGEDFEPELTVIYTPNLKAEGYPNDRVIAVDLEQNVTRVLNSDYFGESKKGGLRMWNKLVYDRGGLPLHAGLKVVPTPRGDRVILTVGLSGTGKTTTTFTRQNDSKPVQDDFVAMMPDGRIYATEDGCFAKTFALDPKFEPTIYHAVTRPTAYLENVYQDGAGRVDFFNTDYTHNGRAVFAMEDLGWSADARDIEKADVLLILNRNENIIPGVARLTREQAAAYFMLGETKGTSAGGADEAGKFLRVPGTNPFFPILHDLQGNRFHDLLETHRFEVFLLNTGRVGGGDGDERSKKVGILDSSAIVKAIAEGTITWERDADFGYEVATAVPGVEDGEILRPLELYRRQGREPEYRDLVARFKQERLEFLRGFPQLKPEIVAAI